jgi:uncharacterized membrane protein
MASQEHHHHTVVERWSAKTLQIGIWISGILITLGLLLSFITGDSGWQSVGQPARGSEGNQLLGQQGIPELLLYLGIILLMLTPFLRVLASLAGFAAEKDKTYVGVSTFVFLILLAELCYALLLRQ